MADEFERAFVLVYRLPEKLSNGYCFGAGVPITFTNVDWFEASIAEGRPQLEQFIRRKRYYALGSKYLVLSEHPAFTFRLD